MSAAEEEATVNPDGSTTFDNGAGGGEGAAGGDNIPPTTDPPMDDEQDGGEFFNKEGLLDESSTGIDPAFYLLGAVVIFALLYYVFVYRKKSQQDDTDAFFSNLDGDKFNLKLPVEVDEYYAIKEKCEASGWEPGQGGGGAAAAAGAGGGGGAQQQQGPSRILAQALMKRAIADIPIVTHIQKESAGMNKLYSQSMCSVKQWRSYQAAEAMVGAEVDEVRMEADQVEPGWSQVIWRQAMQYHNMLKQKHEMEAKAAEEQARKRKEVEERVKAAKAEMDEGAKAKAAEKAAEELIKAEEREKESKKAFAGGKGGMKKGFLDGGKQQGKKKK